MDGKTIGGPQLADINKHRHHSPLKMAIVARIAAADEDLIEKIIAASSSDLLHCNIS